MNSKKLPFSAEELKKLCSDLPTPFYLYDEKGIRETCRELIKSFSWSADFKEFYAVKALPNPYILEILKDEGLGADCSSLAELTLAKAIGLKDTSIMFTSNNTTLKEYEEALKLGAYLNLDDFTHIKFLEENLELPETISFRYNPGPERSGNVIIGTPEEAKYGFTKEQLFEGYKYLNDKGVKHFGIHTMVASNERDPYFFIETAKMLFELIIQIKDKSGVSIEFCNLGGGIGIPYLPEEEKVDLLTISKGVQNEYEKLIVKNNLNPVKIFMENGRMITGPHGYLFTKAIHKKEIYKNYIGVDACMSNLMRPGMYGAYHHISVIGKEDAIHDKTYDVVGSLCENNDKFAIDRKLPEITNNDFLVIHDAGAHGHAMGFQYNGKVRSAEYLLTENREIKQIRRAETLEDYFSTLSYPGL